MILRIIPFLLLFLCTTLSLSQEGVPRDTVTAAGQDTLTAVQDTTTPPSRSGVDTVVTYTAKDSVVYSISTRMMLLYSKGEIRYREMQLNADRINVDWTTALLTATGVPDTADTTGKEPGVSEAQAPVDTSIHKFTGTPIMKEGSEEYKGRELSYNFRTKKGKINVGETEMDEGYYHGDHIKKLGENILFVEDGRYTTCDLPIPHYHFASPKMKVMAQDKVIAEPVYFYVANVPVFALPFAVFPAKGGRRSGIIAPAYAEDGNLGRNLRHLGYYWAINDYMDVNLYSDLYTKGSFSLYSDFRYKKMYAFDGTLSGWYKNAKRGEANDPGRIDEKAYYVNIQHGQEIDPTIRMDANFTFTSNNSYRNTVRVNEALNQEITSNANVSKVWEGTPNSMSVSVTRNQNLITENISETLPSLSFTHSYNFPFRSKKKSSGESEDLAWYEMIGMSYNANAQNSRQKTKKEVSGIRVNAGGAGTADTVETIEEFERSRQQSVNQGLSLSISPKLGPLTIQPNFSYSDSRSFGTTETPAADTSDSSLAVRTEKQTRRNGTITTGVSASTRFYGIMQPQKFGIAAFRHTVEPSLSLSYQKQIIGEGRLRDKSFSAGFNIGNTFEMKTIPKEEGKEGEKIQLLNLGAGLSYDFAADSLRFSPIGLSFRTGIGNLLNLGGGASFDLYTLEQVSPTQYLRVNKFLISEEGRLARMTSFNISVSTSLSGERKTTQSSTGGQGDTTQQQQQEEQQQNSTQGHQGGILGAYQDQEPDFNIPWSLGLSFSYSENKIPGQRSRSANINGNLDFNLTEKWKIATSGGYDIVNGEINMPLINISRDLHCWVMNFTWAPIGPTRHYQFEIRVKAPQLQDIKVTKSGQDRL